MTDRPYFDKSRSGCLIIVLFLVCYPAECAFLYSMRSAQGGNSQPPPTLDPRRHALAHVLPEEIPDPPKRPPVRESVYRDAIAEEMRHRVQQRLRVEGKPALERHELEQAVQTEHRTADGSFIDILDSTTAWEIDRAAKWQQGVGQALFYGLCRQRRPGLILILSNDPKDLKYYLRAQVVASRYGIMLREWPADRTAFHPPAEFSFPEHGR